MTLPADLDVYISAAMFVLGSYFFALYLGLIVWAFRDIHARSRDVLAQIMATLLVALFTIPGLVVYLLLRPQTTLAEQYERSLTEEAILQDLEERRLCPGCQRRVEPDFIVCPNCHYQLRLRCVGCGRLLNPSWDVCPYCGLFLDQEMLQDEGIAEAEEEAAEIAALEALVAEPEEALAALEIEEAAVLLDMAETAALGQQEQPPASEIDANGEVPEVSEEDVLKQEGLAAILGDQRRPEPLETPEAAGLGHQEDTAAWQVEQGVGIPGASDDFVTQKEESPPEQESDENGPLPYASGTIVAVQGELVPSSDVDGGDEPAVATGDDEENEDLQGSSPRGLVRS